jgi:hypothetical protein
MIGVDITNSMELWYKVPQPFDYFIDKEMLGQFQKVFLLILTLLQSQEAFSRILMTKKWKKYHRGSQDHALIVPFIQQCQIFLSGFQHYAFHTSIAVPWKQLETEMDILADRVHVVNMDLSKPVSISLVKQMIKTHSDQIRSNLFLMEDQDLLQSTIKDLFGLVIQFSRFMQDMPIQETLASLYFQFKAKFKTLIQIANDKKYLSSTELERKTAENLEVLLFSICPNIENE